MVTAEMRWKVRYVTKDETQASEQTVQRNEGCNGREKSRRILPRRGKTDSVGMPSLWAHVWMDEREGATLLLKPAIRQR